MRPDDVVKLRTEALHWREIDGETVVLEQAGGRYLRMNETATVLWPLLAEGATLGQLAGALVERFAVPPPEAETDVADYVGWLEREGLLAVLNP